MSNTANDVLSIAAGEIGYCRWDDPEAGTKYGRWYAQDHGSYYGESGVPFCAIFVSWVFDQAGASCVSLPQAYCPTILARTQEQGKTLSDKMQAVAGDVVLFDWDGGDVDHVGIVEVNNGSTLSTIEGNTTINGRTGSVGRRTRSWGDVKAIVRPDYDTVVTTQGDDDMFPMAFIYIGQTDDMPCNVVHFLCGDQLHDIGNTEELKYVRKLYEAASGREIPCIEFSGSKSVPALQRVVATLRSGICKTSVWTHADMFTGRSEGRAAGCKGTE